MELQNVFMLLQIMSFIAGEDVDENVSGFVVSMKTQTWHFWSNKDVYLATFKGGPSIFKLGITSSTDEYEFSDSDTDVGSLAVDAMDQSLYYLDSNSKSIYRLNNFTININEASISRDVVHEGISAAYGQLAFDWLSKNIYWTDDYYDWIAMQPALTNDKTKWRAVINTTLMTPVALAIDPLSGFLFFSDMDPVPRIERCNLLGEDRTTILIMEDMYPEYIAVDHERQRIYFLENDQETVEQISYYGQGRSTIYSGELYRMTSLVFYKNNLCATSNMNIIGCMDVTQQREGKLSAFTTSPKAMAVYDKDIQIGSSKCTKDVRCEHFCVSTPSGARCVCKEGYRLKDDAQTCTADHILTTKGIMFTNVTKSTDICVIDIRAINAKSHTTQCIVSNLTHAHYLQADSNRGVIYFWNNNTNKFQSYDVITKRIRDLTSTNKVKGVFYDWVDNGLYWSDYSDQSYIRLLDLHKEGSVSMYQYTDENYFEYLTGDPYNYTLYWVLNMKGSTYKLQMGTMDGKTRWTITVSSMRFTKPHGLTYDTVYKELFWMNEGRIYGVDVETMKPLKANIFVGSYAHNLNVYKDYLLWIENDRIKAKDFVDGSIMTVVSESHVGSITYYDQRTQRPERGPCEINNGGCQHICVPNSAGPKCNCPFGYTLDKNGKTCGNVPLMDQFALFIDWDGFMYQAPLNKTSATYSDVVAVNFTQATKKRVVSPYCLTYDARSKFIYWVHNYKEIRRSKLNGDNYTTVMNIAADFIGGLAVDQSTGNVYFSAETVEWDFVLSSSSVYIGVLHITSNGRVRFKKLVSATTKFKKRPTEIVLHPRKGLMFWVDIDKGSVLRANMDGKDQVEMFAINRRDSVSLTIDYQEDRVYWINEENVKSVDLDGTNEETFASVDSGSGIAFQNGFLYVSMYDGQILKFNKATKTKVTLMEAVPYISEMGKMVLVPGDEQPVNVACSTNNGLCSTFCLPTSTGRTCSCEEKVNMRDERNCENVCNSEIPHGSTEKCYIHAGGVCDYKCDSLYTKNSKVDKIVCYSNYTWSHTLQTLCEEKKCETSIPNAKFVDACDGKIGIPCIFQCDLGFVQTTYKQSTISCSGKSGVLKWNTDVKTLCTRAVYCPSNIKNGTLVNCVNPTPGSTCKVSCNHGYEAFISSATITCQDNGQWNEALDRICRPKSTCPKEWSSGRLSEDCSGVMYSACSYRCDKGLMTTSTDVKTVICTTDSAWNPPLKTLCKSSTGNTDTQTSSDTGTVAGGIGGAVVVILICVAIAVFIFKRRRDRQETPKYIDEPNVFYNSPSTEENNYNAIMHFDNPITNMESAYDNITEISSQAKVDNTKGMRF